jgi:succinate dehydrogenase / fumarate reductase membrane anchor subunit
MDRRLWSDGMNMRTPLGKVRGLGSARDGTGHFWVQRVTAIANLPLIVFLVIFVIAHLGAARSQVLASLTNPFVAILLALTLISVLWHMRLGLQVVIEDYVHGSALKLAALLANTFFTAALGVASLYAILRMSFGL